MEQVSQGSHRIDPLLRINTMMRKQSTENELSWFTKSNSTVMNNFITDKFDSSMMTPLDCTDSPNVSPLSFCAEPMHHPIPLRLSKERYKNPYEFCPIPRSEQHCTISHDNTGSSFQEIQSRTSNYKHMPQPIEISSQTMPMFVNSMVSQNDWQKFDCRSMKQGPSDDYRQFDSVSNYQGNTLHDAMRISIRNQYLPTASLFDTTNHSSSSDAEEEKKPLKTLSAYNFFFRHERERILAGYASNEIEDEHYSFSKKQSLLHDHWYRDRSQKRSHRKSHGKISFATLSRIVAQRWKELPENRKQFYQDLAAEDLKRYRHELLQRESGGRAPHISSLKFCPAVQMKDIIFEASSFFDFHPVH
jgi:HMG (high mobility group) box